MPKSFRRRKVRRSVVKKSQEGGTHLPKLEAASESVDSSGLTRSGLAPSKRLGESIPLRIAKALYSGGWNPFIAASLLPFPIGALVAKGSPAVYGNLFAVFSLVLIIGGFLALEARNFRSSLVGSSEGPCKSKSSGMTEVMLSRARQGATPSVFFANRSLMLSLLTALLGASGYLLVLSGSSTNALCLLFCVVCAFLGLAIMPYSKVWHVILGTLLLLVATSGLSVLGVYTQEPKVLMWQSLVMGLVPATAGSCAMIIRFTDVLERGGWTRRRKVTNRKGEINTRPGWASLLFSFYVIIISGNIFWMAVLNHIPMAFIVTGLLLIYLSKYLARYYESEQEDKNLWPILQLIYLATSVSMLFVGLMARG